MEKKNGPDQQTASNQPVQAQLVEDEVSKTGEQAASAWRLIGESFRLSPGLSLFYAGWSALIGLAVWFFIEVQKQLMDAGQQQRFGLLILAYFALQYLTLSGGSLSRLCSLRLEQRLEQFLTLTMLQKTAGMAYPHWESSACQDVLMRLQKERAQAVKQSVGLLPNCLRAGISLLAIFSMVLPVCWWVFPLAVALSWPSFYFNRQRAVYARQIWKKDSREARYAERLNELLLNREQARERRLFGFVPLLSQRWQQAFTAWQQRKLQLFGRTAGYVSVAMSFSMLVIPIFALALLPALRSGRLSFGLYSALLLAVTNQMNQSIANLMTESTNFRNLAHYAQDFATLDTWAAAKQPTKDETDSAPAQNTEALVWESLRLDRVCFTYPGASQPVLRGVSFTIKAGQKVALIGLNGAGKTTLTKLILGLYQPDSGTIYLNERPLNQYAPEQVLSLFGFMQQNPARYRDGLRQNLCLYAGEKLEEEQSWQQAVAWLRRSQGEAILQRCQDKADLPLSPELGGTSLSGGEWQRLAFARVLASQRPFLILDEPTSALDPLAEVEFYRSYHALLADHTALMITHRLGSTYLFDTCLVLQDGVIAESGSHAELMRQNGSYAALFQLQKAWYEQEGKQ